ncbi:MAG: hypothetical protein HY000_22940 [Planctomycetes bacterium]|nr:hypothetical protein [Planctomycetota bacterium]
MSRWLSFLALAIVVALGLVFALRGRFESSKAPEIAVFLDRSADNTWLDLRRCLEEHAGSQAVRQIASDEYEVPLGKSAAAVRFRRYAYRGVAGIRKQVRAFQETRFPVAVISPGNSIMTAALAESLQACAAAAPRLAASVSPKPADRVSPATASPSSGGGVPSGPTSDELPILLVTTATAVHVDSAKGTRLLELYPGRTLRFSRNNDYMARQVTHYVADIYKAGDPPRAPAQVILIKVSDDPFSQDLARAFRQDITRVFFGKLESNILEQKFRQLELTGLAPSLDKRLTPEEQHLRERMDEWLAAAADETPGRDTLVVLAMLTEPARRVLRALPPATHERALLLAGDTFAPYQPAASKHPAPWVTELPARLISFQHQFATPGEEPGHGTRPPLLWREIVSATLLSLEQLAAAGRPIRPQALFDELQQRRWEQGDVRERSLAFDTAGERVGDDYGYVLDLQPGPLAVLRVYTSGRAAGKRPVWEDTIPVPSGSLLDRL